MQKEYKTIKEISGPLVFVEKTEPVSYGELVQVSLPDGSTKRGQVLDTSHDIVEASVSVASALYAPTLNFALAEDNTNLSVPPALKSI